MKLNYLSNQSRGHADHGWLKTAHSYSFANYYNPERMGFGSLKVFNDDQVAAGRGFGAHSHKNMEIISIPTHGRLFHKDSMGNEATIVEGEVQVMSAGTGVVHSEMNDAHDDEVRFFQIWIEPRKMNVEPKYSQKYFDEKLFKNKFGLVVAPDDSDDSVVKIGQDAWLYKGVFESVQTIDYSLNNSKNGVFVFVVEGAIQINGQTLKDRDAVEITEVSNFSLEILKSSTVLLVEVPMT